MKRLNRSVLLLVAFALCAVGASAQTYPNRPIKLIVADSAGGAPDQLGRLVTDKLSNNVGQPVVVDNRPGAGGVLGAELVAKSAPDGYTLLLTTTAIYAILPNLRKTSPSWSSSRKRSPARSTTRQPASVRRRIWPARC